MSKKLEKSPEFSDFFNNLIDLCNKTGTSPTTLAKNFANNSVLTAWKNGKIDTSIISKLSKYFNVSTDYLLLGEEANIDDVEQSLLNSYRSLSEENQDIILSNIEILLKSQTIDLPCCSETASAGIGELLSDYNNWESKTFVKTKISQKADFVLIVNGDSMEPDFENQDYVLVRSQPAVDIGQIGIFYMDGKGYIKKYNKNELISLNSKYPPLHTNYEDFRCYGLVLGVAELTN